MPTSYSEALLRPDAVKWLEAVNEEIKALEENNTWSLTELPPGTVGCKWVFAIKTNQQENKIRYKARLVAKGFSQQEGKDYFETYAPVVRYESIRILLAIAAAGDYETEKFDMKTAFSYGDLKEEICLEQPEGRINEEKKNLVYKLHRSLYGLKQSPRCGNEKFVNFLKEFKFKNIESYKCVFISEIEKCIVFLALYVDDGVTS